MTKLVDLCKVLRSKNAGPLTLTIDVMLENEDNYERVIKSGALNKQDISNFYDIAEKDVQIIEYKIVNTIKVTFPRKVVSGSINDIDVYGCQLHRPIANIDIN